MLPKLFIFRCILIFSFSGLLSSCNFNKMFLRPDRYAADFKGFNINTPNDTLGVRFTPQTFQPTFTKHNGRDTVELNYTIESVLFKSSNGNTLNGWFLKPIGLKADITILHLHGNAGSLVSQYKAMSPLTKNGFQILVFDYSGFGFSTGKSTRNSALKDALSALDYIKARPDVANTKLVLYGQSFGGHLSAVVAEERQKDIDALVLEGAFSSAKDIGASMVPVLGRICVKQGYCATRSIKHYTKPVMVIHSTEDKTVPFYMGQKLYDAANLPKQFYEIEKCHICGPRYYTDEITEKIKGMLQ